MGAATNHGSPDQKDLLEDKLMHKASRTDMVGTMKFSVEWWKGCGVFAVLQGCLLGGILLLSGTGFAQLSTASLSGVVKDSSGAAVPKSKVMLKNVATAVEHTTTTNDAGAYLFVDIIPGSYVVSASAQGFGEQRVAEFTLVVGQAATIDFALTVGSQNEVVMVHGVAPQLDTASANLGLVVGTKQVNDLPLNGRDFTQLLTLTPGISPVNNSQSGPGQGNYAEPAPNNETPTIPSVNGAANRSNYFFTDGLSNFGAFHSVYAVPPIIDEIQEFKVVSHADGAEYGSVIGGVVNVVTKSGTNQLHGSAFEYGRSGIFDAQNDFTSSAPSFRQNTFGGVVGGPVFIPKLYDGRNKTFFFAAYQGFRYSLTQANNITVPTAAQLSGDESSWPTQIYNPFSTQPDPAHPGQFINSPFPGNQITPNPNMVAWAKFIFPTAGPVLDSFGHNATDSTPTTQHINQFTARIDQKIGQNDQAWFRYSRDTSVESSSDGLPGIPNVVTIPNRNYGGSYVHVFSPSLILQVEFGRTEVGDNAVAEFTKSTAALISQIGFSPAFVGNFKAAPGRSFLPGSGISPLINGYATAGEGVALHPQVPTANQYSGVLTKTFGNHEIHIGGGFISNKFFSPITVDGLSFGAQPTAELNASDPAGEAINTGDPLATFLLNVPTSADRRNVVTETRFGGVMSEFVQDSWRATPKLTINAGLRYDVTFYPPMGTSKQIGVNGGPETGDVDFNNGTYIIQKLPPLCSVRGFAPCIPGPLPAHVVVSPNDKILHNDWRNFGPHFGFAYKAMDGLVVRGGFGIVYDNWAGVLQTAQNISGLWPDIGQQEAANLNAPTAASPTPTVTAQNPFAIAGNNNFFPGPTPFTQVGFEYDPNLKDPYAEQWNFGVQKSINSSTTLTANYVGSSMHRLDVGGIYGGARTPSPVAFSQANALYPYIAPTFYDRAVGSGSYNGLQVSLDKRYTNGLSYAVSYTFSKAIDVGGDGYYGVEGGVPQDEYNPARYDRSVSGLDLTHILSVNTLYEIPVGKGKRFSTGHGVLDYIVGGWQINNLFQAHSGIAFTPIISSDQANTGQAGWTGYEHLNKVGNPGLSHQSAAEWFNTAAYATPTLGTFGDAGRNSLRGPSYWDLDTSLFRLFPIGEGREFEFRAEAFNVLNHVDLGQPVNDINSGNFGKIGSTGNKARQLQLAAKFIF
jgi:hypothetical protein